MKLVKSLSGRVPRTLGYPGNLPGHDLPTDIFIHVSPPPTTYRTRPCSTVAGYVLLLHHVHYILDRVRGDSGRLDYLLHPVHPRLYPGTMHQQEYVTYLEHCTAPEYHTRLHITYYLVPGNSYDILECIAG